MVGQWWGLSGRRVTNSTVYQPAAVRPPGVAGVRAKLPELDNQTMSNITKFMFEGAAQVRVSVRDDEPWFVLADVCHVLEIGNPADAGGRLDADEKGIDTIDTLGGPQTMAIINESGLYSLILTSRKPAARRFKKWVTSEVLPSIRKTGAYTAQPAFPGAPPAFNPRDPDQLVNLLIYYAIDNKALKAKVAELEAGPGVMVPEIRAGRFTLEEAAKKFRFRNLEDFLCVLFKHRWIYRHSGISTGKLLAYKSTIHAGFLEYRVKSVRVPAKFEPVVDIGQIIITPSGMARLAALLGITVTATPTAH